MYLHCKCVFQHLSLPYWIKNQPTKTTINSPTSSSNFLLLLSWQRWPQDSCRDVPKSHGDGSKPRYPTTTVDRYDRYPKIRRGSERHFQQQKMDSISLPGTKPLTKQIIIGHDHDTLWSTFT